MLTYDESKSHEGSLSISLFRTAKKILLAFISRAAARKSAIEEKMF